MSKGVKKPYIECLGVDTETLLLQIADVSITGHHLIIFPQKLSNRFCFCRWLDNNKIILHTIISHFLDLGAKVEKNNEVSLIYKVNFDFSHLARWLYLIAWSNFRAKLRTLQNRLEVTSSPNCTLRKNDLKQLQTQIVPWTRPFLHRSRPFCTRAKTPWTNFNTLLYTCKIPLN